MVSHFIMTGFSKEMVVNAVEPNHEGDEEGILETLLTDSSVIVKSPSVNDDTARVGRSDPRELLAENDIDDLYHMDGSEDQEPANSFSQKDWKLLKLLDMGFPIDEASSAIDICGGDVSVFELVDSIYPGQIAEESGRHETTSLVSRSAEFKLLKDLPYFHEGEKRNRAYKKRQYNRRSFLDHKERMKNVLVDDKSIMCRIPKPIIGVGLPNGWPRITQRNIRERAMFLRWPKTRVFFPSSEGKETLSSVSEHSSWETAPRWKNNIWVIVDGEKVPLLKTPLLKYFDQASKAAGSRKGQHARMCHHDEFIRCTKCNKERRFLLQTKVACHTYHDALADPNWRYSDLSLDK